MPNQAYFGQINNKAVLEHPLLNPLSWNPILMYKTNDSLLFRSVDFDIFNDEMTHARHDWYTVWRHFQPVHWRNESFFPYIRIGFLLSDHPRLSYISTLPSSDVLVPVLAVLVLWRPILILKTVVLGRPRPRPAPRPGRPRPPTSHEN